MKEYNIYDIEACRAAVARIQAIDTTVTAKAKHGLKTCELRKAVESLQSINYHFFNPDVYQPFYRYYDAWQRQEKKTRLDDFLCFAIRDIVKDLNELIELEHMTHDGRLVRNPLYQSKPHLSEWIEPGRVEWMLQTFSGAHEPEAEAPRKTVSIPALSQHCGFAGNLISVELRWVCPVCGGPRGEPHQVFSYDGSRRLTCDGWDNPCGHVDTYADVRREFYCICGLERAEM
jgi:hypothetical protein